MIRRFCGNSVENAITVEEQEPSEREGRGRRRDEGTDVRSARDTVVSEVIPAKGIGMTEMTDCEGLGPAQWILVYERGEVRCSSDDWRE
ncbi:hypothetical protein PRIPAC_98031 [Pristionchus pacificus]|uniref:Uncharacterized protein n=1 Tax=Pristionchus pacificus TaxID=54126 RepID=A0A2A6CU15_PRIPA|nr:hypothetical protein PRIPAC_98031 [Pristionchus pacificus]|eukprot:PDM81712.1 hypothetical protein PRIPAC_30693 [Pristionchus pacificus]